MATALTTLEIVTIACQIAKVPGYTTQALQLLNSVLQELSQDYDFLVIRKSYTFTFSTTASGNGYAAGSGPNPMPTDFLRLHRNGSFYQISQVPYQLIGVEQEQFDRFVQQPGLASYPYFAYVDVSSSPMGLYVWPPASGAYPATVRYQPKQDFITDTSTVPWFPNSTYLYTRVAGELMKIANDDRWTAFLSSADNSGGAGDLLNQYMKMKDDPQTAVKTVELDRRRFGNTLSNLKNTKTIGW